MHDQPEGEPADDYHVLLLCDYRKDGARTVLDHIDAIGTHSGLRVYTLSILGDLPEGLDLHRFDAIIIHYSLVISLDSYLSPHVRRLIREFPGLKAVFIQDEYRWVDRTIEALNYLGADLLFTCVPQSELEAVYSRTRLPDLEKVAVLTGYVPEDLCRIEPLPFDARTIDVGYRARKLSSFYGQLAREKWLIADRFGRDARAYGLRCDLSYDESQRLYGDAWIQFIRSCRSMLGAESGANVFDFTGEIQMAVEQYEREHPRATFEEIEALFFPGLDGRIRLNQISPRCFEAVALRTQLILYEGEYSNVLRPWRHYVPLRKDHANMADVVKAITDRRLWADMTDCAYAEIACAGRWSYRAFGELVGRRMRLAAKRKDHRASCPYDTSAFQRLVAAHQPKLEALHAARRRENGRLAVWARRFAQRGPSFLVQPARHCWRALRRTRQLLQQCSDRCLVPRTVESPEEVADAQPPD